MDIKSLELTRPARLDENTWAYTLQVGSEGVARLDDEGSTVTVVLESGATASVDWDDIRTWA